MNDHPRVWDMTKYRPPSVAGWGFKSSHAVEVSYVIGLLLRTRNWDDTDDINN